MMYYGSPYFPKLESLEETIHSLQDAILNTEISSLEDQLDFHNLYTAYTVNLLYFATSHRPIRDPFPYKADFNLNEGFAIVNDKQSTPMHRNRLVWLCDLAIEQVNLYNDHLFALSENLRKHLRKRSKPTNESIRKIEALTIDISPRKQSIPYFFFINVNKTISSQIVATSNISPNTLYFHLKKNWDYEKMNISRHYIESYFFDILIKSSNIDIVLFHLRGGLHPFSNHNSMSPYTFGNYIKKQLNSMLLKQGWKPLIGLTTTKHQKIKVLRNIPKAQNLFGLKRKDIDRKKEEELIKQLLETEINKIKRLTNREKISLLENPKELITIITRLIKKSPNCQKTQYEINKQFNEFLSSLEKKFKTTRRYLVFKKPSFNPFKDDWIEKYSTANKARLNLISYFESRAESMKQLDGNERMAEVIFCSALVDGVFNQDLLKKISQTSFDQYLRLKGTVFLELDVDKSNGIPKWRWILFGISHFLILGANRIKASEIEPEKVRTHLVRIFYATTGKKRAPNKIFSAIHSLAEPYWVYHMPTILLDIQNGKQRTTFVKRSVFLRLITNSRHSDSHPKNDKSPIQIDPLNYSGFNPYQDNKKEKKVFTIKEYLTEVKDCKKDVSKKLNTEESRNNKQSRKNLANKLEIELLNHKSLTSNQYYLTRFLIHMCVNGTPKKATSKYKTINKYFSIIAEYILKEFKDIDLGVACESDLLEGYGNIIFKTEDKFDDESRFLIMFFNRFLVENFDTDHVNFSQTFGFPQINNQPADANLITKGEYENILQIIKTDKNNHIKNKPFCFDLTTHAWLAPIIVLSYRFGLRVSEVVYLRKGDVQFSKNFEQLIIQILPNERGSGKTTAATRQIPLIGELSKLEKNILSSFLEIDKPNSKHASSKKLLFSTINKPNSPIEYFHVWRNVHKLLHEVCLDKSLHFHHFRHSFVNHILINTYNSANWKTPLIKFGDHTKAKLNYQEGGIFEHPFHEAQIFTNLSCITGHAHPKSTFQSYFHFADWLTHAYAHLTPLPDLSEKALSYFWQKDEIKVGRAAYHKKEKVGLKQKSISETIYKLSSSNEIPLLKTKNHRSLAKLSTQPLKEKRVSLELIDQILSFYAIKHRNFENFDLIFGFNQKTIRHITKIASTIESESGYRFYAIDPLNDSMINDNPKPHLSSFNIEKTKFQKEIERLDYELLTGKLDLTLITNFFTLWNKVMTQVSKKEYWKVSLISDVTLLIKNCKTLGFSEKLFKLTIPFIKGDYEEKQKILSLINSLPRRLKKKIRPHNNSNYSFVEMTFNNKKKRSNKPYIKNMKSLNRLIFLFNVKTNLIKDVDISTKTRIL